MNKWLKGLLSAIIGGAANSITVMVVEPASFNLGEGLSKLLSVAAVSAIVAAAMYLKQSPLPVDEEPPSILGDSGKASLTYLLYIALATAGLCAILVGTYGCANNGQTVIEMPKESKMALARIAARRMGADMRQEFATVARQVVASYEAIDAAEGTAYQEGVFRIAKMVMEHQGVRDSDLLLADARDVLTIFGVKLPGSGFDLAWFQQFDPADIRAICEAFLEGADA